MNVMLLVLFGLTGAGKTYVGNILKKDFGFYFFEGDKHITRPMEQRLKEKKLFSPSMRQGFFEELIKTVLTLREKYSDIAVSQMFIKEKYRKQFLRQFPNALFVHIVTKKNVREQRLKKRPKLNDIAFFRRMAKVFDEVKIAHVVLKNDEKGKEKIKEQLKNILLKQKINN